MLAKQITDRNRFLKVVAQAIADAEMNCKTTAERNRWIRAIAKGVYHIENHGEFMNYDTENNFLLIFSQDAGSNEIYSANGVCQCRAYLQGIEYSGKPYPCFHRAAARLMRNYFGMAENLSPSFPNAPQAVLSPTSLPVASKTPCESFAQIFTEEEINERAVMASSLKGRPFGYKETEKVEGYRL